MKFGIAGRVSALLAASAVFVLAGPATSAQAVNIDVPGAPPGWTGWSGPASGGITFTVSGPIGPVAVNCAGASASGTIWHGFDFDGADVGRLPTVWTQPCTMPGGVTLSITQAAGTSWIFNVLGSYTIGTLDNVSARITNIDLRVTSQTPGLCNFRIVGAADAVFRESLTQQLSINETGNDLTVHGPVSGCLGLISLNNPVAFVEDYALAAVGAVNIRP